MATALNPGGDVRIKMLYDRDAGYARLHTVCQQTFQRPATGGTSHLSRNGMEKLSVLPPEDCAVLRQMIDLKSPFLSNRLYLRALLEKILTDDVDNRISDYFGSEYLPLWCRTYRNDPGGEQGVSFRWHCDGGPSKHLKILLYLNGSDEHGGNTQFLNRDTTAAFKSIGYVFCDINERLGDLSALSREHDIPYQPLRARVSEGDAILFEPANILHKGVWPTKGSRYLLQICIVPSPVAWRDACSRYAIPRGNADWPCVDKNWPAKTASDAQPLTSEG